MQGLPLKLLIQENQCEYDDLKTGRAEGESSNLKASRFGTPKKSWCFSVNLRAGKDQDLSSVLQEKFPFTQTFGSFFLKRFLLLFLFYDFYFFHYGWFTVFFQFSTVQQSDPVIHIYIHTYIHTHLSFSHIILHHVPSQVTVAHRRISLLIHSKCSNLHLLTPDSQSILLPLPPLGNHKSLLQVHEFLFCGKVHLCHILDSIYKWYHMVFVFLFLTYFTWYESFQF